MAGEAVVGRDFRAEFEEMYALESRKNTLMKDLIDSVKVLRKERNDLASDLDTEREARRKLYGEVQNLNEAKNLMEQAQFVLVLLDADADRYRFNEKFLRRGEKGGQNAAEELMRRVKEHLSPLIPVLKDDHVVIKAYANLHGLVQVYFNNGKLSHVSDLNAFVAGFNRRYPLCDFIDIGRGKEEADNKIRNVLRAYVENPLCEHILLGLCHDLGYVPFLREWEAPSPVSERITLIKGGRLLPRMESLALNKTADLDSVFSSAPGVTLSGATPSGAKLPNNSANRHKSPPVATGAVSIQNKLGPVVRDEAGNRIDRELHINEKLLEAIKQARLCSWYYLRGECNMSCGKNHNLSRPLKDPEFNVVWWLARQGQCYRRKNGRDCDDDKCVYGHHVK